MYIKTAKKAPNPFNSHRFFGVLFQNVSSRYGTKRHHKASYKFLTFLHHHTRQHHACQQPRQHGNKRP